VNPGAAHEGRRGMTEVAVQGRRNVVRIDLRVHADRRRAVMTGSAIVDDAGMVERCRDEAAGIVTDAAILIGRKMIA